ncbi:MAG: hypothetical protein KJZ65_03475 [Phycisphaerales bacterium]|nr:hypothetical protein [Phycisphaerales bacterium]
MSPKRAIPSMFHRRLMLLFGASGLAAAVLAGQTARLTLVKGEELRAEAESKLVRHVWIPTTRGRILDRQGRVLAIDRPQYKFAVAFPVLTGEWASEQAVKQARASSGGEWNTLPDLEREELIGQWRGYFDRHVEAMWRELCAQTGVERGELQRRIDATLARVSAMRRSIVETRRNKAILDMMDSGRPLDARAMADIDRRVSAPIAEMKSAHVLIDEVSDEVAFRMLRLVEQEVPIAGRGEYEYTAPRFPGLEVVDQTTRVYPLDRIEVEVDLRTLPEAIRSESTRLLSPEGVASHVIGRTRVGATAEDAQARARLIESDAEYARRVRAIDGTDRGRYFSHDIVGQSGIEGSREAELRGLRGLRTVHMDTGRVEQLDPQPGADVQLTIDAMLQARIRAVMDPALGLATVQEWHANESLPLGTPLFGAAVVLDIDRAEILAMVSTPTVPRDGLAPSPESERFIAVNNPYVNRAVAKPYPPGSIAKAVILCGAVKEGVHNLNTGVVCTGHLWPDQPGLFRCWIYKHYNGMTHSPNGRPLLAPEAIQRSCNIFFYTLGQRMGPRRTAEVYRWFGVGEAFNLGIGPEWAGQIGLIGSSANDGSDLQIQDAILMGIGQGPVTWTPLHAADAYATIARRGYKIPPRVVISARDERPVLDLGLDRRAVADAMEGLRLSVNDQNGTGHHLTYRVGEVSHREPIFNVPGVEVWGKTGTATAPDLRIDPDGNGPAAPEVVRSGDHSWFVVLVGAQGQGPRYAIAVVMDYAGSGGRVSGPITNQIIWALRAEGYL